MSYRITNTKGLGALSDAEYIAAADYIAGEFAKTGTWTDPVAAQFTSWANVAYDQKNGAPAVEWFEQVVNDRWRNGPGCVSQIIGCSVDPGQEAAMLAGLIVLGDQVTAAKATKNVVQKSTLLMKPMSFVKGATTTTPPPAAPPAPAAPAPAAPPVVEQGWWGSMPAWEQYAIIGGGVLLIGGGAYLLIGKKPKSAAVAAAAPAVAKANARRRRAKRKLTRRQLSSELRRLHGIIKTSTGKRRQLAKRRSDRLERRLDVLEDVQATSRHYGSWID